jgi:methylation protein EvaC
MIDTQNSKPHCRVTNGELITVLDLGIQPLGNGFISPQDLQSEFFYPLKVGFSEESMLLQLVHQPAPEQMFHAEYPFFSGTSAGMQKHFANFAGSILRSKYLSEDPFVVEIGCNDGILLSHLASRHIRHLGIEPAENVAAIARQRGITVMGDFFTELTAERILSSSGQADVIVAANVLCHIPQINEMIKGFKKLLKPNGVIVFEDPYLGDVISKTSYDQIYDEHVFLFSAHSVQFAFNLADFELIDVEAQHTHGGSMRYTLAHSGKYRPSQSVTEVLNAEARQGLHRLDTYDVFRSKVERSKFSLILELEELKTRGKSVAGYGATSKSTTILNYCAIDSDLLPYICDTTPLKQGKLSPGRHLPIRSHEYFQQNSPDVALLFAWNHADEIQQKESSYLSNGGRFLTHVPSIRYFDR